MAQQNLAKNHQKLIRKRIKNPVGKYEKNHKNRTKNKIKWKKTQHTDGEISGIG